MRFKRLVKPAKYNESTEEAKHPGVLLGLIMGVYPAILLIVVLIGIAIVGLQRGTPIPYPQESKQGNDLQLKSQPNSEDNQKQETNQ